MDFPHCPHCGRNSEVESHYSLFIGPKDWPLAALFSFIILVVGDALTLSPGVIVVGLLIAVAPLFLSFFHKYFCGHCEIEFHAPEQKPSKLHKSLLGK